MRFDEILKIVTTIGLGSGRDTFLKKANGSIWSMQKKEKKGSIWRKKKLNKNGTTSNVFAISQENVHAYKWKNVPSSRYYILSVKKMPIRLSEW